MALNSATTIEEMRRQLLSLLQAGDFSGVRSFFAGLPAERQNDGDILQITAIACARSGTVAEAVQLLTLAIRNPRAKPEYYGNLAALFAAQGDDAARRSVLEEGVRRFPGEESLPAALAELALKEGNGPIAEGLLPRLSPERRIALVRSETQLCSS